MKERPILFNGEMVRAILAKKKTQTRRMCKAPIFTGDVPPTEDYILIGHDTHCISQWIHADNFVFHEGDRLWMRETFCLTNHSKPVYKADFRDQQGYHWGSIATDPDDVKWKHPMQMQYGQHRLTLEVTAVRVERLQDISEADAQREGVEPVAVSCGSPSATTFRNLWRDSYGGTYWDSNPWVWVYDFKIAERKDAR